MKTILIWAVSSWSKIPSGTLNKIFNEATELVEKFEGQKGLSGFEKLEMVVNAVKQYIPPQYSTIASTVATLIVNAARLYTLLKK